MPSIDISKYSQRKKAGRKLNGQEKGGLLAFMNRDISFGNKELEDKKKEYFYLEISSLLQAGINLKTAMELITAELEKEKDKSLFVQIQEAILKGLPLSDALQQTGKFSLYEIFSIRIGEESGKLNEVFRELAAFYQNKIKQRRKITSALSYPVIVLSTSFGAVFFMLKFVVPTFAGVFQRFGGKLPWLTQKIINLSAATEKYFPIYFTFLLIIVASLFVVRKKTKFRRVASSVLLHLPLVGNLVQKVYLARFCSAMRLLISAKLPLLRALTLSRQMINYYPIESSLLIIETEILNGSSLHASLRKFSIYPAKMVQLVRVGEETNKLDYFFGQISEQYLSEVEYKTATLSSLIEPLIIIFLGLVVGLIVISMYLPLMQMSNTFQ